MSEAVGGRCARHPDARAEDTCDRCGDYYCRGCADPVHPGVCARCASRLPHGIAWEDRRAGRLPWRFLLTLRDVILRPKVAFPGPARPLAALGFAAICGALFATELLVFTSAMGAGGSPAFAPLEAFAGRTLALTAAVGFLVCVFGAVALAILQSSSLSLGLRMVGRSRGLARYSARAAGYAQGLALLFSVPPFVLNLAYTAAPAEALADAIRYAWYTVLLLWPVATGRVYFEAAQGLGLPSSRAGLAAFGPTLLCMLPAAYASHWLSTI